MGLAGKPAKWVGSSHIRGVLLPGTQKDHNVSDAAYDGGGACCVDVDTGDAGGGATTHSGTPLIHRLLAAFLSRHMLVFDDTPLFAAVL